MRLLEPHILSPVLREMARERQGERAALRAAHSVSCVVGEGTRDEDRMCGSTQEKVHERKRQ